MAHSNPITIGMLAHVDAGKTTLSEAILYSAGSIRKLGRVDNQDTFLDTVDMERARGITIFSKQAAYNYNGSSYTLLDTPGHVDFSAETERTLWVLDAAVLVISGMDGVQGHTETLWSLLKRLGIPVFIFVNKMDQQGTDRARIMEQLKNRLSESCVDFNNIDYEEMQRKMIIAQLIYYFGIAVSTSYLTVSLRNHFMSNLSLNDGRIRFRSTLTYHGMLYRMCALVVISGITGGLAYPLLKIWMIDWQAKNTYLLGDLDDLPLINKEEQPDTGFLASISRGIMPSLPFL